jgi:hypothetical protein
MRLDDWLPESAAVVRERHVTTIHAPADAVYRALWRTDFGGAISRALLAVRLVPALLGDWRHARERVARYRRGESRLTLHSFLKSGFAELEAVPNEELVLGLVGRFWTPSGGLTPTSAATFRTGPPEGQAQAAWNFRCEPAVDGSTRLSTETRVRIAPGAARSRFLAYWFVVRPFSGLLRRKMLGAVRREAEGAATR